MGKKSAGQFIKVYVPNALHKTIIEYARQSNETQSDAFRSLYGITPVLEAREGFFNEVDDLPMFDMLSIAEDVMESMRIYIKNNIRDDKKADYYYKQINASAFILRQILDEIVSTKAFYRKKPVDAHRAIAELILKKRGVDIDAEAF